MIKDRFEAHQKDMSKREFEALKSRSRETQASLMNASGKRDKLTLDEVLGRQFYNINHSARTSP